MSPTKAAPKRRTLATKTVRIEIGNPLARRQDGSRANLGAPAVTSIDMPPAYLNTCLPGLDVEAARDHIAASLYRRDEQKGVTSLGSLGYGDLEALAAVVHMANGSWNRHCGKQTADWVHCPDHPLIERYLADFLRADIGKPAHVERTHWTDYGPPGVGPTGFINPKAPNLQMVASGIAGGSRDQVSMAPFGWNGSSYIGTGTAGSGGSAPTTTTLTATSAIFTGAGLVGLSVIVPAVGGYGVITSVNSTSEVILGDGWRSLTSPGGAAATTPSGGAAFVVLAFAPILFVGLTSSQTIPTPTSISASLPGELTTSGGGLIRKIGVVTHTAGSQTLTLTPVYTTTANDVSGGAVTIYQSGEYPLLSFAQMMAYQSQLTSSVTVQVAGQQLTETVSIGLT